MRKEWVSALVAAVAAAASATAKTPAESKLFERWVDPSSGVVSYLLKDELAGKWNQQAFYFVTKSMSDDGRFLLFNVSDDERVHPVTNCIDCAQTKAFADLETGEVHLLEGTDGGIPYFDTETARLYYVRRDKTRSVVIGGKEAGFRAGPLIPAVFMRDLRSDPFREVKLCDIPAEVRHGVPPEGILDYYTHLTLTKDRRKAFLAVKGNVDFKNWSGVYCHGLLDLETGKWEEWGTSDYYFNHDQICPSDDTMALGANDGCWSILLPGEIYPRLRLKFSSGGERMIPPAFRNYATHEVWNPQGTGFTYGSHNCSFYEIKTGRYEVLCPLRCAHPSVSEDRGNRYVLVDAAGGDDWWRGCPWRVGLWDRYTGRYVDIFSRSGELCPCEPSKKQSLLHPDAHPCFNCHDKYVVSTYNKPGESRMAVMVTPTEPLKARLEAETDETDMWDLSFTTSWIDREADKTSPGNLAARAKLMRLVEERSGEPMREGGRCFVIGVPPPGERAAHPGEGCVRIIGGKAYFWGDAGKAVDLFFSRRPKGGKFWLRDGTFWTTERPNAPTLYLVGDSTLDCYEKKVQYSSSWGEALRRYTRDDLYIVNCARSGISTSGYVRSGRFAQMLGELRKGDWVLIQLGHNDKDNDAYVANLEAFVADVRSKGATPVLASPISRLEPSVDLDVKRIKMLGVAKKHGVEFVDMHFLTRDYIAAYGYENAKRLFRGGVGATDKFGKPISDKTHPVRAGAEAFAKLFVDDVLRRGLGIAALFDVQEANLRPENVGYRIVGQFLRSIPEKYAAPGFDGVASDGSKVNYAVVSLWANAMEFAWKVGDLPLLRELTQKFEAYMPGGEKYGLRTRARHVDYAVYGALPLEYWKYTGSDVALKMGLAYAEDQWAPPRKDDLDAFPACIKPHYVPYEKQLRYIADGYSGQTRLWMDDMYMIGFLQTQAYRATRDMKYIRRAAKEMALYLERLQLDSGLFNHADGVPYRWGRGNGWMAAAMPMILRWIEKDDPNRERILAGYRKMMAALLRHQRPSGLWGQLVDDDGSWDESSCSAMFAYGLNEGVREGWLDDPEGCRRAVMKCFRKLAGSLDDRGNVPGVCVGTGAKDNRQYYLDRARINGDPHGQAPLLWLVNSLMQRKCYGW